MLRSVKIFFLSFIIILVSCYSKPKGEDFVKALGELNGQVTKDIDERVDYLAHNSSNKKIVY